ncbi:MAG TPA: uracil phosphoribosyltransferase, partial [Planctomycetota bacterium]|nr:uracil phosphoribosyltransferase [Planctomycetota bacterium]
MIRVLDEEGLPLIGQLLLNLRDVNLQKDRDRFLTSLRRLGFLLAYEAMKTSPHILKKVSTPLGVRSEPAFAARPVLATVLRAGLPLWQGAQEAIPEADSLVLGAAREEGQGPDPDTGRIPINVSYARFLNLTARPLIYCDPMLATGSTLIALHPRV